MQEVKRTDVINLMIEKYKCEKYLEIGFQDGVNFKDVKCGFKTAVDPNPFEFNPHYSKMIDSEKRDFENHSMKGCFDSVNELIIKTSDDFFQHNNKLFDIVFIDGLHTSEQVLKDFVGAWYNTTENAVIVLHDMNPTSLERAKSFKEGGVWNGDCYKLSFLLNDSDLFYITVSEDQGTMVVLKEGNKELVGFDIDKLDNPENCYSNFDARRKELLNLVNFSELVDMIEVY